MMKDRITTVVLAVFFGWIGIHQFYLKNTTKGFIYALFFWTGIPFIISIFDILILLNKSKNEFNTQYNKLKSDRFFGLDAYLSEYPNINTNTVKLLYKELEQIKMNYDIAQKQVQDFMLSQIEKTGTAEKEQIKTYLTNGFKEEVADYDKTFDKMYFSTIINDCIDDEMLSPDEINLLIEKSNELNLEEYNTEESIRKLLGYYVKNWELDNGIITEVTSDFILNKNEMCFYKNTEVELLERKEVTNKVNYAGPRARIKIAKGLSYNLGSYNFSTGKTLKEISKGTGIINITTKRILFKTTNKNTVIRLSEIIDIEPYSNSVVLFRSRGNPYLFKTENGLDLYQAINGGIKNL